MSQLLTEIEQLDFCGVKSTAHKLKSSFFMMGIDDESILTKLELETIEDFITLENLYFKLEKILSASLKHLEIELVNL
jgi:hypothetical protein